MELSAPTANPSGLLFGMSTVEANADDASPDAQRTVIRVPHDSHEMIGRT